MDDTRSSTILRGRGLLMQPLVAGLVVYMVSFAIGSALLAVRRQRNPAAWLLSGAVIGPIAIGLLLLAPPGRCPTCGAGVRGWLDTCVVCGRAVKSGAGRTGGGTSRRQARPLSEWLYGMPTSPDETTTPTTNGAATVDQGMLARAPNDAEVATLAQRSHAASSETILRVPPIQDGSPGIRVLASGVFVGGSTGLEVGSRYEIGRHDGMLTVLGPVDSQPGTVQIERPLDWIAATTVNGRLVVSDEGNPRSFSLVFENIAGMSGEDLEASLQPDQTVRRMA